MRIRIHNTASDTPYLDSLEALRHLEPVAGKLLLPLPAGQLTVQHLLLQLLHPLQNSTFLEQINILLFQIKTSFELFEVVKVWSSLQTPTVLKSVVG
jgi:hypothetical protein